MMVPAGCVECMRTAAEAGAPGPQPFVVTLDNDLKFAGECPSGHPLRFVMQNLRYELLYDQAINMFHLGVYREALLGCATALERFFEFAMRVMFEHAAVPQAEVAKGWKPISRRTEQQQGGFLVLYLLTFKRPFAVPKGVRPLNEMSNSRNDVIHNGEVPTEDEALQYAREVYEIVRSVRDDSRGRGRRGSCDEHRRDGHRFSSSARGARP